MDTMMESAAPAASRGKSLLGFVKTNLRDYGMLFSLAVIMVFFQYMTEGTLLQPLNITNLVLQNSYIVIMALGMLLAVQIAAGVLAFVVMIVLSRHPLVVEVKRQFCRSEKMKMLLRAG